MKTLRVLAPGEFEETGDFESEAADHQPTTARGSPVSGVGFGLAWTSVSTRDFARFFYETMAADESVAVSLRSARNELANALRGTTLSHGVVSASILASLLPLYHKKAHAVHRAESAHDIARRMALESPAVAVEPFTPVASDNPARDLRDWTQLTTDELARMCRVTGRRFQHWLGGARMSSRSEERLLRLRYQAGILATGFGPAGVRRWFRAPHPELGRTPIEAIADGREDTVHQLVERYIESPAT